MRETQSFEGENSRVARGRDGTLLDTKGGGSGQTGGGFQLRRGRRAGARRVRPLARKGREDIYRLWVWKAPRRARAGFVGSPAGGRRMRRVRLESASESSGQEREHRTQLARHGVVLEARPELALEVRDAPPRELALGAVELAPGVERVH